MEFDSDVDKERSGFLGVSGSYLRTILVAYVILGLLAAIMSAGYVLISVLQIELNQSERIGILFSGISLSVSAMSAVLLILIKQREAVVAARLKYLEQTEEFLDTWVAFEKSGMNSVERSTSKPVSSPRAIMENLRREGKITDDDLRVLRQALEARNDIVHRRAPHSVPFIKRLTEEVASLTSRLML